MTPRVRERFTRALLSSLLGSNFTVNEMKSVALALATDDEFSRTLTGAIMGVVRGLDQGTGKTDSENHRDDSDGLMHAAIELIKSRRLRKDKVLSAIRTASPIAGANLSEKPAAYTVKQMVEQLYLTVGEERFGFFIRLLMGDPSKEDGYLKGIMERK